FTGSYAVAAAKLGAAEPPAVLRLELQEADRAAAGGDHRLVGVQHRAWRRLRRARQSLSAPQLDQPTPGGCLAAGKGAGRRVAAVDQIPDLLGRRLPRDPTVLPAQHGGVGRPLRVLRDALEGSRLEPAERLDEP